MSYIKSLSIMSISLLIVIVVIFFYTFFKFSALEERIGHLEQKIESPETKIMPTE